MTYKLLCDSCTDFTPEMHTDAHVVKVPLSIHIGAETIVDDEDLVQSELLKKMKAWPDAPKTSCPAPHLYAGQFIDGDNYIVTLSAKLSGSYNAAVQGMKLYQEEGGKGNVHVFNSRSATCGQTQVALRIQELAEKGTPFREVVEKVERFISEMHTLFVLENLDNLRKNGRLTKMQSLVTGALHVKLLCAGTREGEIEKLSQGLTIRQTLAKMVARAAEDPGHAGKRAMITHCNCLERAEHVRELLRKRCQFREILIVPASGISTVYANDGGIVFTY